MLFDRETLMQLLSHISEEDIADIALLRGKQSIQYNLLQRGKKIDYNNVLWFISQILGTYHNWFRCDHHKNELIEKFHFTHNCGYKWSVFITNYLSTIFTEILNLRIDTIIFENAVNIEIQKK